MEGEQNNEPEPQPRQKVEVEKNTEEASFGTKGAGRYGGHKRKK